MSQGSLFEPQSVIRAEVRDAIERLDFAAAGRRLKQFRRLWPEAELTWEPELIRIGAEWTGRPLDLDSGYGVWGKLESRLGPLGVPRSRTASIRRHFFSRLLAASRRLFEELHTPAGRSLGDFYLLAEQPNNARRLYEHEVRQLGDGWELRLGLGHCNFRLGHRGAAHSNYHWSFLLGLPEESWERIEDPEFLARLREVEDPEWAFPDVCAAGDLPAARFSTRREFEQFKSRFTVALTESPAPRRFCLYWIVSENKPFCTERELLEARRQMKALNPRLHARYMQRLE